MTYRLAGIFAHPDDDTHGIGGSLILAGDDVRYTLIVATSGEAGEIVDPARAAGADLAEVREGEELRSIEALGVRDADVHFLRYLDGALERAPREELVRRIAAILRKAQPHVVVTFGPEGITRHSDHIVAGQAATEAFHRARAEAGSEGGFQRLLYSSIPQSELDRFWEAIRSQGVDSGDPEAPFMPRGVPDHTVTVRVDARSVVERKVEALRAHATQATPCLSG
jgi:LmbE family N-acetylglucosaminyl deacetylase